MRQPSIEQAAILAATDVRVRVVRAVPGSGKTWLVAEVISQTIATNTLPRTSGVAALSFTKVGGDEIRKAIGHDLSHPHFVGTIDAFLFRYVIRPHLQRTFGWQAEPRILAGEWGPENWAKFAPNEDATLKGINLFGCVYLDEQQGKLSIAHKSRPPRPLRYLSEIEVRAVGIAKMKIWKKHGLLTHSDAALWASRILDHSTVGPMVCAEIARRFPLLIVDELQDTGHFLGKSIRTLLCEPTAQGVLVGDPDQAIFQFTGARPDLFSSFETIPGAVSLPLSTSRRCSPAVANAATHLKESSGSITPNDNRTGRAILVRYNDLHGDVPKIVTAVQQRHGGVILKVIARGTATVNQLSKQDAGDAPRLYCPSITHMHRGVLAFRQRRYVTSLAATRAALELAVFQHENVRDERLIAVNIDPHEWKRFSLRCLLKANSIAAAGSFYDWQTEVGRMLELEIVGLKLDHTLDFIPGKLKPQKRKNWDDPAVNFLPRLEHVGSILAKIPTQTVHKVKGETHDITIFVCPSATPAHCPSVQWWSANEKHREEKRIAYVAMTRSHGDLILCVEAASYKRLLAKRLAFVESFESMTVDQCVASFQA